jgi:chromosome segregation ATPase
MDKETLRKQITDELESEFESRLKQFKRQKEQAQEELESASERWRSEKRRLNSEIDRLESALNEAKNSRPKRGITDSKPGGLDPAAIAKLQETADDKLKKASQEWDTERARLQSQVNRLEGAVAEAIERSSNPMRATQSVKEQFEVELTKVTKEKTELEQAFLRAKTEWEQEKLKMTGEMVKLRRAAQIFGKPVPKEDAPEVNPKVRDLENQLKESFAQWNAEREKLAQQIQKLEESSRHWDTERRQLNDHAAQLQQAFVQAQAKVQGYEVAARSGTESSAKTDEIQKQKDNLEHVFQAARNDWDAERRRLQSEIERAGQQLQRMSQKSEGVSTEVVDQLRKQYEKKLQDAIEQKTQLAQQLQSASSLLESERTRLSKQIKSQKADDGGAGGGLDKAAIDAEVARIGRMIEQIVNLIDDSATDLSTVIRKNVEKAELDAYLKGILFALGRGSGL